MAKNESMSPEAREYQEYVTGKTGEVFRYNGVDFDGFNGEAILDAKDNYRKFIDPETGRFKSWFSGADDLVDRARRQLEAAQGVPIEWHFYQEDTLEAVRKLLEGADVHGIDLVYDRGPMD